MKLYWGDLHNHCNITYGFGSLENAMELAKTQLDFVAITGHAMWPDIYERTPETEFLIDFHLDGFKKLRRNWPKVRKFVAENNRDHEFVTFQAYEMHSSIYGDHHFVTPDDRLQLFEASNPKEWVGNSGLDKVIAIPHHIAYTPGYRGINWNAFDEKISPVVEVISKHGCSMSDMSPYNYYHNMGPRDSRNTAYAGLKQGYKFGFVGSTDHHAGYPGSYGDGRLAVLAEEKTRESIWNAIINRHTYALTGDKIKVNFTINDNPFGSEINAGANRDIRLDVSACDYIDKIVVYKNLKPYQVICGENIPCNGNSKRFKIRVEMGWGKPNLSYKWEGTFKVSSGKIISIEPCFRGRSVLSPQQDENYDNTVNDICDKILEIDENQVKWICETFKNISPLHPQTSAMIFEVDGSSDTLIDINLNGRQKQITIGQLLNGSITDQMMPYNSQAFIIHRAIPQEQYDVCYSWKDMYPENDCDIYHVEIKQANGQCAWISPIYVNN